MNWFLAIPIEVRLLLAAALGAAVGSLLNRLLDRLHHEGPALSPWSDSGPRSAARRVPIFGWLVDREDAAKLPGAFWVRPLLVELLLGCLFAVMYSWQVDQRGLLGNAGAAVAVSAGRLHAQYAFHMLLVSLMMLASLIDLDETIIPDSITVPGTLAGLAIVTCYPPALLPVLDGVQFAYLHVTSPNPWPAWMVAGRGTALALALGCWIAWCQSLQPQVVFYAQCRYLLRRRRAKGRDTARSRRRVRRMLLTDLWTWTTLLGLPVIAVLWSTTDEAWQGLLTGLVGLALGGAMVWAVRLVGYAVLRKEAMGFGDVTLLGMIGVYLGWQSCLMIFFIAPLFGMLVGIVQLLMRGSRAIPFGPFLCLAAMLVLIYWASIWPHVGPLFGLGWLLAAALGMGLVMMAILLGLLQVVKRLLRGGAEEEE